MTVEPQHHEPPPGALGAELVWWREDGRHHTLLTLAGPMFVERMGATRVTLGFALHDVAGRRVASWSRELGPEETLFYDSRQPNAALDGHGERITEGALVVWVTPTPVAPPFARFHSRSAVMVDWLGEDGDLVSLHSDQSVIPDARPLELGEMVFVETEASRTSLVLVNGPEEQPAGALILTLRNAGGHERRVVAPHPMAPFTVQRVALRALAPDLVSFCDGRECTVTGRFQAQGVFTRPYVVTEDARGALTCAYHGGDRYRSRPIPRLVHRSFAFAEATEDVPWQLMLVSAQQEMNPAYARSDETLTTRIHLFQSHGELEEDFFVDASLFDVQGRRVAHRERWAIAPRQGVTTCEIRALCGGASFEGHVALRFSVDATKEAFPRRVQALVEYRTAGGEARTMLWSDRWNAPDRVRRQGHPYRALYRVLPRGRHATTLAVTNPSVAFDYARSAPCSIRLRYANGDELGRQLVIGPHATLVSTIDELFPERRPDAPAIVIVESLFDLASMHLTRDLRSGAVAAEHLLGVVDRVGDDLVAPCGV